MANIWPTYKKKKKKKKTLKLQVQPKENGACRHPYQP